MDKIDRAIELLEELKANIEAMRHPEVTVIKGNRVRIRPIRVQVKGR